MIIDIGGRKTVQKVGFRLLKNVSTNQEAGFTVTEVLIALAILSLSLSTLFASLSQGFYDQRRAYTLAKASTLAQNLLARPGADLPLREGKVNGRTVDGLFWVIATQIYGTPADHQAWGLDAFRVSVSVFADPGDNQPIIELHTLRLGHQKMP